jgi:leucyl aminopeptidase
MRPSPSLRLLQALCLAGVILTALSPIAVIAQTDTPSCGYDPRVAALLADSDSDRWVQWIAELSGDKPVRTPDGDAVITTRSSQALFDPAYEPSAFSYLKTELIDLGYSEGIDFTIHTYDYPYEDRHPERNWKNLILTLPGSDPAHQAERVLMVAHLDSISEEEMELAPGADDNATGAAGLLEAAALLREARFERTINLIWFTGEEQSRRGSEAFVEAYSNWLPNIEGVINLDMFGFDWDGDRCFELHTGGLPGSQTLGNCLAATIEAYDLDLAFDLLEGEHAYTLSDHYAFWQNSVPAVMVMENFSYQPDGPCNGADRNYHYHQTTDTLTYINVDTGFAILQAGIATLAHIAVPWEGCELTTPQVTVDYTPDRVQLHWTDVGAAHFEVWQQQNGHWFPVGQTRGLRWTLAANALAKGPIQVFAIPPSECP